MKSRKIYLAGLVFLLPVIFSFGYVNSVNVQALFSEGKPACSNIVDGQQLCAETQKLAVRTGEIISLNLMIRNVGKKDVNVDTTSGASKFVLVMFDENGTQLPTARETKIKYHLMTAEEEREFNNSVFVSHRSRILEPNDTFQERLTLGDIYDLSRPGTYFLEISRATMTAKGKAGERLFLPKVEIKVK